jgi:hypothetical protein
MTNGPSYMVKYLRISSYIRKPFHLYDFAPDPIWISSFIRKILFSFLSVWLKAHYCTDSSKRSFQWHRYHPVIRFVSTSVKFLICTVVGLNGTLFDIEYRKGWSSPYRDFFTILWDASMEYIIKLATPQSLYLCLLKIKCGYSRVIVNIFASTSVLFTPTRCKCQI